MNEDIFIALDLGGTKFLAAAINANDEILTRERADTPISLEEGLELVKNLIRKVKGNNNILAIGASGGGPLNYKTGVVSPLNFPEWREIPLKEIIEKEFGVPFYIDVDTNVAALAEYNFSEEKWDRLLYVTLSTGVGGGLVVDGEIYRGGNGSHPEIGHQAAPYKLPVTGPISCFCGGTDCFEAIVSGTAIKKIYGKKAEELTESEWDQVIYNFGQGLRNVAAIYAPSIIVLGGGMALGGGDRLLNGVKTILEQNLKIVPVPRVAFSKLGYDTALWGALVLARSNQF